MTNTYAINTTRGKEFEVEAELAAIGLKPWVPRILLSKNIKEKKVPVWYDRAYVPKLLFCVFPAVYWRDVAELKHVHGKPAAFSRRDIDGRAAGYMTHPKPNEHIPLLDSGGQRIIIPEVPGLRRFKEVVEAEYAEKERLRANNEFQCHYAPGQALELLSGPFEGLPAVFREVVRKAHDEYAMLKVDVSVFGRDTPTELAPDKVRAV